MSLKENSSEKRKYWDKRAAAYNKLSWVKNKTLSVIADEAGQYNKCLDLGCGTGAVLKTLISLNGDAEYVGIDISDSMSKDHELYQVKNIDLDILTPEDIIKISPDLVTARMVMHHITNPGELVNVLHSGLDNNAKFILCEGVVPSSDGEIVDWYTEMFKYKEKRHTFLPETLLSLFDQEKWDVKLQKVVTRDNSLSNWINNSGISADNQPIIRDMHFDAPESVVRAYNFKRTTSGDILMDWEFVILTATVKSNFAM
ncbi:MAG: methyltransferase [Candidatus Marinimicrobia bacterium]|nr:methyltransferase [Candidatus Neomarinimicrobiota bacterium]